MSEITYFDIQRCSLVDGPGMRTTVFFKGCNLHCQWCHNPESQRFEKEMMFHKNRCTGCGACARVCPEQLKNCTLCEKCTDFCPSGAREIAGKRGSTEEIMKIIVKDRRFYDNTGGGATFSGGECMLQPEGLLTLLKACRAENIRTAVDTAGAVSWERFEEILPFTDMFLYDLKCMDDEKHRAYTGVSNRLILENLRKLSEAAQEKILIRIPVIPGVNDGEEDMRAAAAFLKECGIRAVELLPYHQMGEHKYEDLGKEPQRFSVPSEEKMKELRAYFG